MNAHDGTIAPPEEKSAQQTAQLAPPASAALPGGLGVADLCRPVRLRTGLFWSLFGVWHRHYCVYRRTLLANSMPPVLEPLFFFTAVAFGLGGYLVQTQFAGLDYRTFVATGLIVASAMFTAVFETTFGTFVRLVFQKTYDAMLGTHLRVGEIFAGEMMFAGTKGAVFSTIVLLVTWALGVWPTAWCVLVPLLGFLTSYLFAAIGLVVTSFVKMINNFAFFTTGVITPMFFFSGTFFPIRGHFMALDVVSYLIPLTPSIELVRDLYRAEFSLATLGHAALLAAYVVAFHVLALRRMERRVLA